MPLDVETRPVPDVRQGGDRFASLASMIPGVVYQRIVTIGGEIRYTYISEGARDMFGVEPQDILDDPEALFRTYSEEYKSQFKQRLIEASQEMRTWDVEASIVGTDGNIRYTHAIAKPERLADGSVLWTGLILDATRIKLVEDELKSANRSVEAANRAKSLFLANMSHEIRTPMNGVLGMTDLLLKTNINNRQVRLLTTLRHSAKTLLGIINDVLDISRIEAGRFELDFEPFDIYTCLEDTIDLCANAAYAKGLEIGLIVDGPIPDRIVGDVGRLRQVLINLIGNAVKFTDSGSAMVYARTVDEDGRQLVRIQIVDTGIGIAAAAKESLFAPFTQADSSISRKFGGTGLGLAITRHLVTLMSGTVALDSTPGKGTTVTVDIPYTPAPSAASPLERLDGQRILVADNRSLVRQALASKISGLGATIDEASDELETTSMLRLAAADGHPYSHLVVDRLRPNIDATSFCAALCGDPNFTAPYIIRLVSLSTKETVTDALSPAAGTSISKPVRRSDLLAALTARAPALDAYQPELVAADDTHTNRPNLALRVLLAEDNPVNQELALEYLNSFGCDVELANNGEEAVAAFTAGKFDIVLMDCQMPVLDGLSAVRAIRLGEARQHSTPVPIVAVTANAYESDRQEAQDAGMNDYLVKPYTEDELYDVLQRWLAGARAKVAA